ILRNTTLGTDRLDAWCDSMASVLALGTAHNFEAWPILGQWVWPSPQPIPTTYLGEVEELKDFFHARWSWLDDHIPGLCLHAGIDSTLALEVSVAPNPFTDGFEVRGDPVRS